MFAFRPAERRTLLISIDFVIVELTTLLAFWIMAFRAGWAFNRAYLLDQLGWFIFLPALWFFSAFLSGFYNPNKLSDLPAALWALARTVVFVVIVYLLIYFLSPTPSDLPRGIVAYQGTASFVLIGLWRLAYVWLIHRPGFARKVIVIGAGWAGQTIASAIKRYANAHYRVLGFVDDDPAKQPQIQNPKSKIQTTQRPNNLTTQSPNHLTTHLPILGKSCDLVRLVKSERVPEVILAVSHNISSALFQALLECKEQGVQITLMPVLFEQLTGQVPIEHIGDNWNVALPLDSAEAGGLYPIAKRLFDITGALIGLALYAIIFPFIALAIKLDSPGPLFYTQARVGKGGKVFELIKLRTMIQDAEPGGHAVRAQAGDARITRVGRWLRKARLDEMPQLINILKGDMSAVGPRPERPEHLSELDQEIPFHRLRNAVKPGMAGWAVVNYDYVDNIEDAKIRLQYDLYYIKHQSLWLDLIILLRTMGHMIALRGR